MAEIEATEVNGLDAVCLERPPLAEPIASRPATGPDFLVAFLKLQGLVTAACRRHRPWEAKVAAAIEAALGFAAHNPSGARALTLGARRPSFGTGNPEQIVISYFARELGAGAPRTGPVANPNDESVVAWIATVVRAHLLGEDAERLPYAAPDLIYLAVAPRLGFVDACRCAELAAARLKKGEV